MNNKKYYKTLHSTNREFSVALRPLLKILYSKYKFATTAMVALLPLD
ncbi:MAG: hypothetical protein ACI9C4_000655 [Paraglaciecola sp.]|jgi:hypothetical protein